MIYASSFTLVSTILFGYTNSIVMSCHELSSPLDGPTTMPTSMVPNAVNAVELEELQPSSSTTNSQHATTLTQLEIESSPAEQDDEANYPTGAKWRATIVSLMLVSALVGLDMTMVTTAIPTITAHFKTIADVGWYAAALRLAMCATLFMFSKMYTLASIKKLYIISLVIFEAGCLLCTVAWTSHVLIAGRVISGLGVAGLLNGTCTRRRIMSSCCREKPSLDKC